MSQRYGRPGPRSFPPRTCSEDAMRRWRRLSRLFTPYVPRNWGRCILVVEQLEAREVLSPVVTVPGFLQTPEGTSLLTDQSNPLFGVIDFSDFGQRYTAVLSTSRGTLTVNLTTPPDFGFSIANNNTSSVTITGQLNEIQSFVGIGSGGGSGSSAGTTRGNVTFNPTAFYSGDAPISLI